jgi:hypothetical protein
MSSAFFHVLLWAIGTPSSVGNAAPSGIHLLQVLGGE